MDPLTIGAAVSAGSQLLGGLLGDKGAKKANAAAAEAARRQEALQREFAQNSIQWRVEDAKKAGIHPLYAIGAQSAQYSPVYQPVENASESMSRAMGAAGSAAGQMLGRRSQPMPAGVAVFPLGTTHPHWTDPKTGRAIPYTPEQAAAYYAQKEAASRISLNETEAQVMRSQARIASQPGSVIPLETATQRLQEQANTGEILIRNPDGTVSRIPAGTPTEVIEQLYGGAAAEVYGIGRLWRDHIWEPAKRKYRNWRDRGPTSESRVRERLPNPWRK